MLLRLLVQDIFLLLLKYPKVLVSAPKVFLKLLPKIRDPAPSKVKKDPSLKLEVKTEDDAWQI